MIFLAKHLNPRFLLNYFKSIEDITDLLSLIIGPDGLFIKTMDSAHISFIDSFLDSSEFSSYNYNSNEESLVIGLNLKYLCKILSVYEKIDTVSLSLDNMDKLGIVFDNGNRKSEFELKLILIDEDNLEIPSMDYEQEIDISYNRFSKLCQEIDTVNSETIKFNVDSSKKIVDIYGTGDLGAVKTNLKESDDTIVNKKFTLKKEGGKIIMNKKENDYKVYPSRNTFEIEFSLKKLQSILKIGTLCNKLLINLSEDSPIKMDFNLTDDSYLHYYVAPKIVD
jgi:proliferating cell nuclear antigen